jgi:maltose O-acetyltransferase
MCSSRGCYVDPGFGWLVSIGDDSTLGPDVTILTHDSAPKLRTGYTLIDSVRIGDRVFIGANVTILPGVTVGDDAIVGAGSVVSRDVAPGTIVVGGPAHEVGTTDGHTRRHRDELQRRPRFAEANSTQTNELEWDRMREQLRRGPGYVR